MLKLDSGNAFLAAVFFSVSAWAVPAYTEDVEPNNTSADADARPALAAEGVVRGKLTDGSDESDVYRIALSAGDRFVAFTLTHGAQPSTDTLLELLGTNGTTVLLSDNDSGQYPSGASALSFYTVPSSGTYYLRVSESGADASIRSYALVWKTFAAGTALQDESGSEPNNSIATATTVTSGMVAGSIALDTDVFRLPSVQAGSTVVGIVDDATDDGTSQFNFTQTVALQNASGQSYVSGSSSTVRRALVMTPLTTGDVFFNLTRTLSSLQTYHLWFFALPPAPQTCATYAGAAGAVTGTTLATLANDVTAAGTVSRVELDFSASSIGSVQLKAPNGQPITVMGDSGSNSSYRLLLTDDALVQVGAPTPTLTTLSLSSTLEGTAMKPNSASNARMAWWNGVPAAGTWNLLFTGRSSTAQVTAWSLKVCTQPDPGALPCGPNSVAASVLATDVETDPVFTSFGGFDRGSPSGAPLDSCHSGNTCFETNLTGDYSDTLSPSLQKTVDTRGYFAPMRFSYWQQFEVSGNDRLTATASNGATTVTSFDYFDVSLDNNREPGMSFVSADVSPLVGSGTVTLSWLLSSTPGGVEDGWMVDDVKLEACAPAVDLGVSVDAPATTTPTADYTASIDVTVGATPGAGIQRLRLTVTLPTGTTLAAAQPATPSGWTCSGTGAGPRLCDSNPGVPVSTGGTGFLVTLNPNGQTGPLVLTAAINGSNNQDPGPNANTAQDTTVSVAVVTADGGTADAGTADAGLADAGLGDAGLADAGTADAGTADAGTADAGTADAGAADAGTADAGTADAGTADAGTTDAGAADAGTADAGATDAGATDAGATDAGTADAGATDAGATDGGTGDGGPSGGCRCGAADDASGLFYFALSGLLMFSASRRRGRRTCVDEVDLESGPS